MTNTAVTGTPAPVSYSLPRTNAKVLELLEPQLARARRVLDIGAGEGYLARRVHDLIKSNGYAAELEACDLFPGNFRVPEVPCHAIDLHGGMPLDDQSVDLAYSVEVLEHLEDQFHFFREVHRVLRPGGRFVLTTPNVLSLTSRVRTLLSGFPELFGPLPIHGRDPQHVGGHIHPVSVYYIAYMAEKTGLRVIGCSTDRTKSGSAALLVLAPLVKLGAAIVARFKADEVDGVLLLSAQTARTYARLMLGCGLSGKLRRTMHFCLSADIAKALDILGRPPSYVPSVPNLKALLTLVARSVSNLP